MNRSMFLISFFLLSVGSYLNLVDSAPPGPPKPFFGPESPVAELSPEDFKCKINSDGVVMVEFFAPWCGACVSFTPAWEKAATALRGIVQVTGINVDAYKDIGQEYQIKGFPTIKAFVPGKPPIDYQSAWDAEHIVNFALEQVNALAKERVGGGKALKSGEDTGPSASVELTEATFDESVIKSKDLWMVEFYAPWCGACKALAPDWKAASNKLQGKVKLGQVNCDNEKVLMSKYQIRAFPTVFVFGADKETPYTSDARSAEAIETYALAQLEKHAAPAEVTELTSQDVLNTKCASGCFVAFLPDDGKDKYLQTLLTIAEKFKANPYGYVWAAAGKQPELEKHVGVSGKYPTLVALSMEKGVYVPLQCAFEIDPITEFVKTAGLGGDALPCEGPPTVVNTASDVKMEL